MLRFSSTRFLLQSRWRPHCLTLIVRSWMPPAATGLALWKMCFPANHKWPRDVSELLVGCGTRSDRFGIKSRVSRSQIKRIDALWCSEMTYNAGPLWKETTPCECEHRPDLPRQAGVSCLGLISVIKSSVCQDASKNDRFVGKPLACWSERQLASAIGRIVDILSKLAQQGVTGRVNSGHCGAR